MMCALCLPVEPTVYAVFSLLAAMFWNVAIVESFTVVASTGTET